MRNPLVVAAIVLLTVISVGVAVFLFRGSEGEKLQQTFFDALNSGDRNGLVSLFHPGLRSVVDEPVLDAYMKSFQTNLGKYLGVKKGDFTSSVRYEGSAKRVLAKGTVRFFLGEAKSDLEFIDGKLIRFSIKSPKMEDWLPALPSTDIYKAKGEEFLRAFLDRPDAAFEMMHEALRKEVPIERMRELSRARLAVSGRARKVDFRWEKFSTSPNPNLRIHYVVQGERASFEAELKFIFLGFSAHLISFAMP